jgi:serine/threonine-protein kinase
MTPTVRARVVDARPTYQGATGYEMEWSEDESTTTTWGHDNAQPALQYATSFLNREPVSAAPSARSDQVQVVRYELPPPPATPTFHVEAPRPRFAPVPQSTEEMEAAIGKERVLGAFVWTVLGAAGLFCAVVFMRLLVSDGASDARANAAPAVAPSAPAPSAPAPNVQQPAAAPIAAKPEPAVNPEPAAPKAAAPVIAPEVAEPKQAPKPVAAKPSPKHTPPHRAPKPARAKHVARPAPKVEKRPAHAEPAAPAPRAKGTLRVNSLPWAQVFVDGKLVGNTPQMGLPLSAGRHKIKLVNPPLEMTKVVSVEIEPGQVVTKTINLSQ